MYTVPTRRYFLTRHTAHNNPSSGTGIGASLTDVTRLENVLSCGSVWAHSVVTTIQRSYSNSSHPPMSRLSLYTSCSITGNPSIVLVRSTARHQLHVEVSNLWHLSFSTKSSKQASFYFNGQGFGNMGLHDISFYKPTAVSPRNFQNRTIWNTERLLHEKSG